MEEGRKMDLKSLIAKKDEVAQYMLEEITHICKNLPKRDPGSEGEKLSCEYMAKVLKDDCGCERADVESFKENPGSFYGWIYITVTCMLISVVMFFFVPWVSIILILLGLALAVLQFGMYKKVVDWMFPEKTGHNVTAVKKCAGEPKRRIFFNGHPDAAWEWPVNYLLGGVGFESHALIGFGGAFYYLGLSIAKAAGANSDTLQKCALWGLIFVPFWIGLFFLWNKKRVVDGANDNLTGCLMGIALLREMERLSLRPEHTEVGVILTGSEEAGLRGAKAWCEAHKDEYRDVPTYIISYDSIYNPKELMVNMKDLNSTVRSDRELGETFLRAAETAGIPCRAGKVPLFGGATDSAAFTQGGFRSVGVTGLSHTLERFYHTRLDTSDSLNPEALENCYKATVELVRAMDLTEK
jgi:hypothetical protein